MLAILDATIVLDLDASRVDLTKDVYVGNVFNGLGLDVFFGDTKGGYHNVLWFKHSGDIGMYNFNYKSLSEIQAANSDTVYYTVNGADVLAKITELASEAN